MRNIDILFFIEHVDRELDVAACLVERLERRFAIHAEVRNFYSDMRFCLRRYNPAIVVTPFFYYLDHHPMKDYVAAWPKATFFNMAWEQILYKVHTNVKIPKDRFAKTNVRHVCWTERYRKLLVEQGTDPDHLVLTGNPVMKFYDEPYRGYFKSRKHLAQDYGLDPNRKWILFPENYRWAFLSQSQLNAVARQDADPDELSEAAAYCRRSLTTLFAWLVDLSGPNAPLVILRPRPATALEELETFGRRATNADLPNLRIIKAESAREWVMAADHVISSYSTTLIEAALAGKSVHVYSPEPFPEGLQDEWYEFVPMLKDRQSFVSTLQSPADPSSGERLAQWARRCLLPAGDPIQLLSDAIARLHSDLALTHRRDIPDHKRLRNGQVVIERARKLLQRQHAFHRMRHRLDDSYVFTSRKHEKDVFGADDVANRASRWHDVFAGRDMKSHTAKSAR
jgi:surface carbohydrate biosynthesis protein